MLLARLPAGRLVVGLPGNPLAAVSGVLTLVQPLLAGLAGRKVPPPSRRRLGAPVARHPQDTRLVPVLGDQPLHYTGPAMLRGIARADGVAVVPPGTSADGSELAELEVLDLSW